MPRAEVYEDLLDLEVGLLDPLPLDPAHPAYPLPPLAPSGRREMVSIPCVVLENPYLRATIAVGLGGRLLSLFDRVQERDLLPVPSSLTPVAGGVRGAELRHGIELDLGVPRRGAMGPVRHQIAEPDEEEDPAGVWIEEIVAGTDLSFHAQWALPPDRAELRLEWRVFHRGFEAQFFEPRLRIWGKGRRLAIHPGHTSWEEQGRTVALGPARKLWPRELATFQARILPAPAPEAAACSAFTACVLEDMIAICSAEDVPSAKLLLATADGTLEAKVDLKAGENLGLPLGGVRPEAVAIRDAEGNLRGQVSLEQAQAPGSLAIPEPPSLPQDNEELEAALQAYPLRAGAAALLADRSTPEPAQARTFAEQAVNYNADDHLSWHLMAACDRWLGQEADGAALANAHYLAPMEPVLRAEAFLSQPNSGAKEANPLLAPLREAPDEFLEAACRLIELGRLDDAQRFLDETLRHEDLPMARYLLAYAYLQGSRMAVEAAEQVAAAGRSPLEAAPWRAVERRAVAALAERFPHDPRLPVVLARATRDQ